MYGAILGDIVGSPYEFDCNNYKAKDFPLFSRRSDFTDDTVMTLAVAKALLSTRGQDDAAIKAALVREMQQLGRAYPDRGYGTHFGGWLYEDDPQPYQSYGNGSAMRVSSAAWLAKDMAESLHLAQLTAEVTHDHPEGIKGAQAVAAAIFLARTGHSNTISSNVMGSVHYSSPEQVRGGYSDYKSDIYSLGITMYEMVTGRVPFDGDTTVAIAIKHLQEEIESPSKYTPNLPFALEQIILKCTQKSPDRRYNNMAELIDDLKHSLMEPQGNFVKVTPLSSHAETVMVSAEELSQIRSGAAAKANAQTAEEPARKRYSKIEDEEEDEDYSYEDEEDEDEDEE